MGPEGDECKSGSRVYLLTFFYTGTCILPDHVHTGMLWEVDSIFDLVSDLC